MVMILYMVLALYIGFILDELYLLFHDVRKNGRRGSVYILVLIDRLFNVLCLGRWYATISARLGYLNVYKGYQRYRRMRKVVDWAFKPIDGKHHCVQAYQSFTDTHTDAYINRGGFLGRVLLCITVCVSILPIAGAIRVIAYFKN